jgi:hypothetical protein
VVLVGFGADDAIEALRALGYGADESTTSTPERNPHE